MYDIFARDEDLRQGVTRSLKIIRPDTLNGLQEYQFGGVRCLAFDNTRIHFGQTEPAKSLPKQHRSNQLRAKYWTLSTMPIGGVQTTAVTVEKIRYKPPRKNQMRMKHFA